MLKPTVSIRRGLTVALSLCALAGVAAPPIRILPVGDSITYGSSVAGGYRLPLYQLLTAAGYNVDFVGTQVGNGAAALPDPDHEGHGGWRIDQIDGIILSVFAQVADPDVIIVMIGTNDYGQDYNVATATNRLDALITKMAVAKPHTKIIIASLTKRGEPKNTQIQTTFNPYVPGIVAKHAALGRQVYFTDMYAAVPLSDMPDNLHPGANGYAKMATNWFQRITTHFAPEGSTNAPAILGAQGRAGLTNVVVTFSKPIAAATVIPGNFALNGGVNVLAATLDPVGQRAVTLTTTPQGAGTLHTVTVNGVRDQTAAQTAIAPGSTTTFLALSTVVRGAINNVAEAADYTLVYSLDIPNTPNYQAGIAYTTDLHAFVTNFSRIAYYLELQASGGELNYAWASLDAFTTNVLKIGVPTVPSGAIYGQPLTNLTVISSVAGVTPGTNMSGGNIEFWPSNYTAVNASNVVNASATAYDWGDSRTTGTYGSMQIHNHAARQTVFAFNRWGGTGGAADLGIGNRAGSTDTDWTFAQNAATYTIKTLQVFVKPLADDVPPALVRASALPDLASVLVRFSRTVANDATNIAHYALSGGATVLSAALDAANLFDVTLTTTALTPATRYTVTVNGVRSRTGDVPIAPDSTASFYAPAARGVFANVPQAADYALAYSLSIPNSPVYSSMLDYDVDVHTYVGTYSRIAYYLELEPTGGVTDFIWVEMDPFTTNPLKIGVPTVASGAIFQQPVSNLTVRSTVAGIVTGTNMPGGNIEFWPSNYNQVNAANVTNASATQYDFGDNRMAGNHGSMQIHNHDARQTLFAFNNWGGAGGVAALGIGNRPGSLDTDWTHAANAGSYAVKSLQVFVLPLDNSAPPVIASVKGLPGWTNVVIVFSKPLTDAAADPAHYALSGGATVLGASLDVASKARVTLTTSPLAPGVVYTVTVNGLADRTVSHAALAADSAATFTVAASGALRNVPAAADYQLVYSLAIPAAPNYAAGITYDADLRAYATNFSRVAYYLELQRVGGAVDYVWAEMDPFTNSVARIGVPTVASGENFQRRLTNLTVQSSVAGVLIGTNMSGGNLEFWPVGYNGTNAAAVPNATDTERDWGDMQVAGNYGSMQIHNHAARHTVFAFNRWGGAGGNADLGIGNRPAAVETDWTFAQNAAAYSTRTLQVYVLPNGPTLPPILLRAVGRRGWTNVVVTFSKTLDDSATNVAHYAISGGVTVQKAVLNPTTLAEVTLTTSIQAPSVLYTLTVNGVTDRTLARQEIAPDSTATFYSQARSGLTNNVPEAVDFRPIYTLPIPNLGVFKDATAIPYTVNNSGLILPRGYDRVAYYLELDDGNELKWVYASMDDIGGQSLQALGLAHNRNNPLHIQRYVTNLNIYASLSAGVTTGAGIPSGNVEMWSGNYAIANALAIPNASATTFDWGDQNTGGVGAGHGSFQVHNYAAGQVLFGYNRWGGGNGTGASDLGIGNNLAGNPDWTHMQNAGSYTVKTLQILVRARSTDPNALADPLRRRVPETRRFELVYDLRIPDKAAFNYSVVPYTVDRSLSIPPSFGRIAYHLELTAGTTQRWVYTSMAPFTQVPRAIGVPSRGVNGNGNRVIQQPVTSLNVYASPGCPVVTGTGIMTGNIEFWPSNYTAAVSAKAPANASATAYDFGDTPAATGDHACMQVHNADVDGVGTGKVGQTIFAYNNWGNGGANASSLGIGSQPTGQPDWTFNYNAGSYSVKHLQVLVLPRVYVNVPEAANYTVVYAMDIPNAANTTFNTTGVPYQIDRSADLGRRTFSRVAYYLELQTTNSNSTLQWVYVSCDAFTPDLAKIGVPNLPTGVRWQTPITNMNVYASAGAPVTPGTGLTTGRIEFWPNNYGTANEVGVPGADGNTYDFGDDCTETVPQGYGCMQIHNPAAGQVLFAYNAWGGGGRIGDIGIGNNTVAHTDGKLHKDWTFRNNAGTYKVKNLFVLAEFPPEGSVLILR